MTKSNGAKGADGLNGNGDAEFYVFALPGGSARPQQDHVIYKVVGERTARDLCELFGRRPGAMPPGTRFRPLAALAFSAVQQIEMDELLDCLDVYGHPDPKGYAVRPSPEVMWRAQCAARARKWDRRLREKRQAQQAHQVKAMVMGLADSAAQELSAEQKLAAALQLLQSLTPLAAIHAGTPAAPRRAAPPLDVECSPSPSSVGCPPSSSPPAPHARIPIGRLEYLPDFSEVWVDGRRYNLKKRRPARRCIQYLVEQRAFDEKSARHQLHDIHPFVIDGIGSCSATPKVHDYFNDRNRQLTELRQQLVKPVARTGRYYLAVG